MSTILGEATASARPPGGGQRGVAAAFQGWCAALQGLVYGRDPHALLSCAPGAKGRQAGRLCILFMAGPPPSTVNREAGSWHRGHLGSEGPR